MTILPLTKDDAPTVWEFLRIAAHENTLQAVQTAPLLARYAQDWGRQGDFGFKVLGGSATLGLCWVRLFPQAKPGFGWLSAQIPELSLAVHEPYRGQGIGRLLLENLIDSARQIHPALSLSVRSDNQAAVRLYEGCGFVLVPSSERVNRVGGTSFTMRLDFE